MQDARWLKGLVPLLTTGVMLASQALPLKTSCFTVQPPSVGPGQRWPRRDGASAFLATLSVSWSQLLLFCGDHNANFSTQNPTLPFRTHFAHCWTSPARSGELPRWWRCPRAHQQHRFQPHAVNPTLKMRLGHWRDQMSLFYFNLKFKSLHAARGSWIGPRGSPERPPPVTFQLPTADFSRARKLPASRACSFSSYSRAMRTEPLYFQIV